MPILAKRPAPKISGKISFCSPSGKKTTRPTRSRIRIAHPVSRVRSRSFHSVIRRLSGHDRISVPSRVAELRRNLPHQLPHLFPRHLQGFDAVGRGPIDAAMRTTGPLCPRGQIALAFEPMEHRIQCAWADLVAVPRQLLDYPVAVQVALGGMVQNVE